MKRLQALLLLLPVLTATASIAEEATNPRVVIETSKGQIVLELYATEAPKTVENFLGYVESGYFDGTIFHRVIPDFMVQGGGFTADMKKKETRAPVPNEADNGLKNDRGTVAMARTGDSHSATAQFFVNTVDNDYLNHTAKTPSGWGYTVFAKVIEGMDVVDVISAVKTGIKAGMRDVPAETVMIKKASLRK